MTGQSCSDYTEFRLTHEEFVTILDALSHARDEAVHSDGRTKFRETQAQLIHQSDHHAQDKRTTSDRFTGGGSQ